MYLLGLRLLAEQSDHNRSPSPTTDSATRKRSEASTCSIPGRRLPPAYVSPGEGRKPGNIKFIAMRQPPQMYGHMRAFARPLDQSSESSMAALPTRC